MKAFITRREEKYRPPWGRLDVTEPRQCVFAGSTNGRIPPRHNWQPTVPACANAQDRYRGFEARPRMIFAEAVDMFKKGNAGGPTATSKGSTSFQNRRSASKSTHWEQPIKEWLEIGPTYSATSFEILRDALHIPTSNINPAHGRRVADIMRKMGWEQDKKNKKRPYVGREETPAKTTTNTLSEFALTVLRARRGLAVKRRTRSTQGKTTKSDPTLNESLWQMRRH